MRGLEPKKALGGGGIGGTGGKTEQTSAKEAAPVAPVIPAPPRDATHPSKKETIVYLDHSEL